MNERLITNLRKMAECWSSRVQRAKSDLEQGERPYRQNRFQQRATFRQYGLSLACVHEELDRLTGTDNWRRAQAYERYTAAVRAEQQLRSEGMQENTDGTESAQTTGAQELEAAEQKADSALWEWCAVGC